MTTSTLAVRRPVTDDTPLVDIGSYDYADAFEIAAPDSGPQNAALLLRQGLEDAPLWTRFIVRCAWRMLGFRLGPANSPDHILGWRIVEARNDAIQIEVSGTRMDGVIVGRLTQATMSVTTYVRYVQPAIARRIWGLVGIAHRRVAPYLLERSLP